MKRFGAALSLKKWPNIDRHAEEGAIQRFNNVFYFHFRRRFRLRRRLFLKIETVVEDKNGRNGKIGTNMSSKLSAAIVGNPLKPFRSNLPGLFKYCPGLVNLVRTCLSSCRLECQPKWSSRLPKKKTIQNVIFMSLRMNVRKTPCAKFQLNQN